MRSRKLHSVVVLVVILTAITTTSAQAKRVTPSPGFVEQALCVHSGWQYTHHRVRGRRPEYHLFGHWYWRTWKTWSNGEGSWSGVVGNLYGGGLSFMVGTWNSVGAPYARSTYDIARQPPAEQIRHAWLVVRRDGDWHEWPVTSRACGL